MTPTLIKAKQQAITGGWIALGACTYEASDDPTYTFSFASDMTTILGVGMRIKLTDSGVQCFIITAVGAYSGGKTIITGYGGTDYNLTGGAITLPYYSMVKAPLGFPLDSVKWTVEYSDASSRSQATPVNGTWYNINSASISIPIGVWRIRYEIGLFGYKGAAAEMDFTATLSTANNSESDLQLSSYVYHNNVSYFGGTVGREKSLALASKTSYYLNSKSLAGTISMLQNRGDKSTTVIRAVCTYL